MSMTGILMILVAALILFGPDELPKIARSIGKIVRQAQKIYQGFTKDFREVLDEPMKDIKSIETDLTQSINRSLDLTSPAGKAAENKASVGSSGAAVAAGHAGSDQAGDAEKPDSGDSGQDTATGLSADKKEPAAETLLRYEDSAPDKDAAAKAANPLADLPQELVRDKRNETGTDTV